MIIHIIRQENDPPFVRKEWVNDKVLDLATPFYF